MTPELKNLLYEKLITQFVSSRLVAYVIGLVAIVILRKNMSSEVATVLGIVLGGYFTAKTAEQIKNAVAARKSIKNGNGGADETIPEDKP